jgi:hypothetical protein
MMRRLIGASTLAYLVACGGKKQPESFTVGVTLGDAVGVRLDGLHMTLAGQDAVLDHGKARFLFPSSTPPLAGQSGELVVTDTPCGVRKIAVPLGITAEEEEHGRAGNADVAENIFKMLDLAKLGLAPAQTSFYLHAPNAKTVAIGKRVIQAPIPKTIAVLDAECAPLQVSIDGVLATTAPKDVPPMKEPRPPSGALERNAVLISADPKTCFVQRTYTYGGPGTPDSVTFSGSNIYKLTRVWYSVVLEPESNYTKSSRGVEVLTALQQVDCD